MNGVRFLESIKLLPLLAPVDIVATATATAYVDLNLANWCSFLVDFGAMTSDSTDVCTVTVESSTAGSSNATEAAIAFKYRLSAAIATDTMGDVTAATTAGVAVTAESDGKLLWIDVDPSAVAETADRRFLRLVLTPNAEMASCIVGAKAFIDTRYKGANIPSST